MNRRSFLKILGLGALVPTMIVKAAAKAAPAPIEVNGGLTLAKLIEASRMLDQNEVAEQGRYLFYAGEQMKELIANVDRVDAVLYNDVTALMSGKVNEFMGFIFVQSQLVLKGGVHKEWIDRTGCRYLERIAGLPVGHMGRIRIFDAQEAYARAFAEAMNRHKDRILLNALA